MTQIAESESVASGRDLSTLRVLAVLGGIDPRIGGPPSSARDIWISAGRAGIDMTGAVCVEDPPLASELDAIRVLGAKGISVISFPFTRLLGPLAKRWGISLPLVIWLCRSVRRYDVIQVHSCWMFSSIVALVLARLAGCATVTIPHESLTTFDLGAGWSMKGAAKRLLKKFVVALSNAIVFSSQRERDDSIDTGAQSKAFVIYHPVVDDRREPRGVVERRSANGILRVGFLGRLHPKKNLEALIDAIAELPGATLTVTGDGPEDYRSVLVRRAASIADRVQWRGFVDSGEISSFFDSIDVLVMPSFYECFGRAGAEAMAHGVPTVVSKRTGIGELIARHKCGMVVGPDAISVRTALLELAKYPEQMKEFSSRAAATARETLSIAVYGSRIACVYRRLIPGDQVLPPRNKITVNLNAQ